MVSCDRCLRGASIGPSGGSCTHRANTKDSVETYCASLTDDRKMLVIWTKEDDEAGRTSPKLDTPPLSGVTGSNEKSTGEITAGQASSIDSGLTPKINHPHVQANAISRSSSQPPDSGQAAHTKIPNVRFRSSMHPRYVGVKTRLIALWHQSPRHEKSPGGTLFWICPLPVRNPLLHCCPIPS